MLQSRFISNGPFKAFLRLVSPLPHLPTISYAPHPLPSRPSSISLPPPLFRKGVSRILSTTPSHYRKNVCLKERPSSARGKVRVWVDETLRCLLKYEGCVFVTGRALFRWDVRNKLLDWSLIAQRLWFDRCLFVVNKEWDKFRIHTSRIIVSLPLVSHS